MTLETKLNVGDTLYALYVREARLDPVCGACEGAKTFSVVHADGQTRDLPCGHCHGKGKLVVAASQPVLDVCRMEVHRISMTIDEFGIRVQYIGEQPSQYVRAPAFSLDSIPTSLIDHGMSLRAEVSTGSYLPYGWLERKDAARVAPAWQGELQRVFATRRRE